MLREQVATDRRRYLARLRRQVEETLRARNEAAADYWHGRGTRRALRRRQADHAAACNRWNMAVRADMRRHPTGSHATRAVAPMRRQLPRAGAR